MKWNIEHTPPEICYGLVYFLRLSTITTLAYQKYILKILAKQLIILYIRINAKESLTQKP